MVNPDEATRGKTEAKSGFWRYEYTVVLIFWLITGFVALDRYLLPQLLPLAIPDLGMTYTDAGLVVSITGLTWCVAAAVFGGLSDRWGRKVVIVPAAVMFSLLSCVTGAAQNVAQLFGLRALLGIPDGAYLPPAVATIGEEASPERRGMLLGIHITAFSIFGFMLAPIYAATVGSSLGWRWALFLTIIPGLFVALVAARIVREPRSAAARVRDRRAGGAEAAKLNAGQSLGWVGVLRNRNILICCGLQLLLHGANFIMTTFAMVYLTTERHIDFVQAGMLMAFYGIGSLFGAVGLSLASDHIGRRRVTIAAAPCAAVAAFAFSQALEPFWFPTALFFFAMFCTGLFPMTTSIVPTESVATAQAASGVGIVLFIGEGIASVLPMIGGVAADAWGLSTLMLLSAVLPLAAAVVAVGLKETAPRIVARRAAANEIPTTASRV